MLFLRNLQRPAGRVLVVVLLFLGANAVHADQTAAVALEAPQEQEIRDLVTRLGSTEYRQRRRAESDLHEMGSMAVEVLQENDDHPDMEIRIRVRRLIGNLRSRFIQEAVPADLKSEFKDYQNKGYAFRKARVENLRDYSGEGHYRLLASLARFEESDLLAKDAALILLESDPSQHAEGIEAARDEMLSGIELSKRVPAEWVRLFAKSQLDDLDPTINAFRQQIEKEREQLQRFDKSTEQGVVRRLARFLVRLQILGDRRDDAKQEISTIIAQSKPTTSEAVEFLDWLETIDMPEAVGEFHRKHANLLERDTILLYRLAKVYQTAGDKEQSEKVAQQAFDNAGGGIKPHFDRYLDAISSDVAKRQVQRRPAETAVARYFVAVVLDDKIGNLRWAEREYKAVLNVPTIETNTKGKKLPMGHFQTLALISFSEMLHDQERETEAGDALKSVVDACEKSVELTTVLNRNMNNIKSRMHFFYACGLGQKGKFDEQQKELIRALNFDKDDVDVLIGMYRCEEASEEWKNDTEARIAQTAKRFDGRLRTARNAAKNAALNNDRYAMEAVALYENQQAWLIGNTIGDIDEAIRGSEHSLVVFPNEGGYLDTLGRCYYRKGDLDSALKFQRRAVRAAPHELQIQRQLRLIEDAAKAEATIEAVETKAVENTEAAE